MGACPARNTDTAADADSRPPAASPAAVAASPAAVAATSAELAGVADTSADADERSLQPCAVPADAAAADAEHSILPAAIAPGGAVVTPGLAGGAAGWTDEHGHAAATAPPPFAGGEAAAAAALPLAAPPLSRPSPPPSLPPLAKAEAEAAAAGVAETREHAAPGVAPVPFTMPAAAAAGTATSGAPTSPGAEVRETAAVAVALAPPKAEMEAAQHHAASPALPSAPVQLPAGVTNTGASRDEHETITRCSADGTERALVSEAAPSPEAAVRLTAEPVVAGIDALASAHHAPSMAVDAASAPEEGLDSATASSLPSAAARGESAIRHGAVPAVLPPPVATHMAGPTVGMPADSGTLVAFSPPMPAVDDDGAAQPFVGTAADVAQTSPASRCCCG